MKLYRRPPEPGQALGRRAGGGKGKKEEETHAEAVKRGGPQGSAANATVWIPPLGNAQLGGGGGTQEKATRDRGQGRDELGASRRNCGDGGVKRGGAGCGFGSGSRVGGLGQSGLGRRGNGCGQNVDAVAADQAGAAAELAFSRCRVGHRDWRM